MRIAIAECVPEGDHWSGDLYFSLERDGCLELSAGKDGEKLLVRICDVDDFLAVAKGIEDFYWKNKIGNKV